MATGFEFHFDWDATKAASNRRKHRIDFDLAATVFRDPLLLSIADDEHDDTQQRWITMGLASNNALLVVIHTYHELSANAASVRIISARLATPHEQRHYEAST